MVYILAVVGEEMILDADPLSDMKKQWVIYYNNLLLKPFEAQDLRLLINSFLHIIFHNSFTKGGQDD